MLTRNKYLKIALSFVIPVFIIIKILTNSQSLNKEVKNVDVKYILYWDKFWNLKNFPFKCGHEIFENCSFSNCFITKNRTLLQIEDYSAIIFHGVEYKESVKNKPARRASNQIYIYLNLETPFNTPKSLKFSRGFFNWTISYR